MRMLNISANKREILKEFTEDEIEIMLTTYSININELIEYVESGEIHTEPTELNMVKWINDCNSSIANAFNDLISQKIDDRIISFKDKTIAEYIISKDSRCIVLPSGMVTFMYE